MHLIAADWGTTHLRAFLIEMETAGTGRLVEERRGIGVTGVVAGQFETTLSALIEDWLDTETIDPILVSGMATSTLGWREVAYGDCPAGPAAVLAQAEEVAVEGRRVLLLGGLRCTNPLGQPDVMRGEELQTFGGLAGHVGKATVLLPGTHNKWVSFKDGHLEQFLTIPTGELFAVLREHSILVPSDTASTCPSAFVEGVQAVVEQGAQALLPLLFSTRARQLAQTLPPDKAAAYLSGLLVGADTATGLATIKTQGWDAEQIVIIGDTRMTEHYATALGLFDHRCTIIPATEASIAGYTAMAQRLQEHTT